MRLIDADALERRMTAKAAADKDKTVPVWSRAISVVHDAPTVDPVRHGKWYYHPTDKEWDVCSVCGTGCKRREYIGLSISQYYYHYCPSCGAKMDGDANAAD